MGYQCGEHCGVTCGQCSRNETCEDHQCRCLPRCDDSVCGEGGICDACELLGGITTDDEMFIPLGSYFVQEP